MWTRYICRILFRIPHYFFIFSINIYAFTPSDNKHLAVEYTLDKNIDGEERIIKLYGWIAQEMPDKDFTIFMPETRREFSIAYCVMLRLTDPDGYRKIINWE